ncbi:hypothetical protein [Carboxylicivirga caseinilyticus]|uniref:hypothetical protein n=1 Tax=Carboxylicivirga caseinilyticus TaxID=3417572 RepID=UPI003D33B812|nr:hypothetical protein [Marinilabiliaceae bacterium A049]
MKWVVSIILILIVINIDAQQSDQRWYQSRYNVSSLDELGIEKLQIEKDYYSKYRNAGVIFTILGPCISIIGVNQALNDFSPFSTEKSSDLESADGVILVGAVMFIGGILTWAICGSRHHQIKKSMFNLNMQLSTVNANNSIDSNILQVGFTIRF